MIIGIPKEIKDNEYRVSLTPGWGAPAGWDRVIASWCRRAPARAAALPTPSTPKPARPSSRQPPRPGQQKWS